MVGKPKSAEMHPGPGFRIRKDIERPDPEVVAAFHAFDTPAISDMMNRLYTMKPTIQALTDPNIKLIGPACTVKVYPGDNLMVHKSLDILQPGDVVVVDTSASTMSWGTTTTPLASPTIRSPGCTTMPPAAIG